MSQVAFGFPITSFRKLEDGRLEVEGLASDETIDSQGDIVDYDGLKRAAQSWRGNIREAHDPKKPVGRALDVTFDDTKRAMFVRSFISAGAPETQAKVMDGTLGSYSVGGGNPSKVKYEKVGTQTVRRVLEWPMSELSLVDAPANPNANFELVKADGRATELLDDELVQVNENRLAAKLVEALEKGKGGRGGVDPAKEHSSVVVMPQPMSGDATTVETKKPAQPAPQSAAKKKKPAETVETDDAAPGTVDPNANPAVGASAEEIVISAAAPTTEGVQSSAPLDSAEASENKKPAPGTAGADSSAPLDDAEASENKKPAPGTAGPDSVAPLNPPAESVEAAGVGNEPATGGPDGDATEGEAEAGGSDTEADLIDGKPRVGPKGKFVSVPKKPLSGKSTDAELAKKKRVRSLLSKYFYGGEQNDIASAAQILSELAYLYEAEAAEGEDESPQLELIATAISAIQRFTAMEGLELASSASPSGAPAAKEAEAEPVPAGAAEPPDTSLVYAAKADGIAKDMDAADEGTALCQKCGGVMACQKCQKSAGNDLIEDPSADPIGWDNIMPDTDTGKGLIPRMFKAAIAATAARAARAVHETYAKTLSETSDDVFKANHGDQLAEGIGKGLSIVSEEFAKAQSETKGFIEAGFKGLCESIDTLKKTAAVPMPLRSARVVEKAPFVETEALVKVRTLESALASVSNPEAAAELQRMVAVARINAGLAV